MRRSDYRAPSLHPNARDTRKTRATAAAAAVAVTATTTTTRTPTADDGHKAEDEDVMRLPESSSSDDDDDAADNAPEPVNSTSSKARTSSKRKLDERERPARAPPSTRQLKRARRQKLQDTKLDPPAYFAATDDDLWGIALPPPLLSSSQRGSHKLKKVYTSSMRKKEEEELKTFKPDIRMIAEEEDEQGTARRLEIKKPPPPLEESATGPQPELKLGKWQTQEEKQEKEEAEEAEAQPEFKTYSAALESFSPISNTSSSTNAHHMLDLKGSPTNVSRPGRSTSSLSSLDSLSSTQEDCAKPPRRTAANDGYNETKSDVVCTVCRKVFSVALLPDMERNMRSLSLQSQRDICYRHQLAEAQEVSRDCGYPAATIDWAEVEGVRIPKLLTHLRQVLQRKTPCFYLEQLDVHAAVARSKPRLLRTYLHSGVLDVVKPGYYGPKGQKVVCNAITNALTRDLKQASRDDHVVRAAGVGAYVAAVLVPECTMRLVMEDIKTRSQDRARDVLAESSDIGRLLNPDDDRIEVVDGE